MVYSLLFKTVSFITLYIAMLQSFHLFHYLILDSLMIFSFLSDSPFTWRRFSSLVCIVNFWSEIQYSYPPPRSFSHYHQLCWRLLLVLPTSLIVSSSSYHAVFGLISVVYPHLWTLVNLLEGRDVFYWSSYTQTLMQADVFLTLYKHMLNKREWERKEDKGWKA